MLYTRKGDGGTTKLFDSPQGVRISKDDIIFEALGTLDELNSSIGYTKALTSTEAFPYTLTIQDKTITLKDLLELLQNNLFSIQAELAGFTPVVTQTHIEYEEAIIAAVEEVIPEVKSFLIPGGDVVSAYLDVCRTVARRAERLTVKTSLQYPDRVSEHLLQFLNRLSSVLYALARFVNHTQNMQEKPPTYQ
jgi:cob(I)alamin adenosyltransferase